MLAGLSVTEEPTGLLEIRVKIQTLTFWLTPNSCRSREQRAQKRRFPEWRASSPPKRPPSDPGLNHLGGAGVWLMSHMGPSPFVSAILGEQPWAPRMPTEPYSHLEGQMDKPLPQRAPGPLRLGAVREHGLGVSLLPPATPPPTVRAAGPSFILRPHPGRCSIRQGATSRCKHQVLGPSSDQ